MNRKQTTKFLSDLLVSSRLSGMGKYYASEVTLDYGQGKGKEKRVDFMQFVPENQLCTAGIEKGIFICYEIKSCKADFNSGHGLNFEGDKNYIVTTMEVYKELVYDMQHKIPHHVGVMVACPYHIKPEDDFQSPTSVDEEGVMWDLKIIKQSHPAYRTRSMAELLFCMLRSGK